MYVAVKGGEKAIAAAHALLDCKRRGDLDLAEVTPEQISEQLGLAVDRVMAEGSLYDRHLAALAIKQAQGDLVEAIFLVRAYRTTLSRFGVSEPVDTSKMRASRRISATWKDIPGGQILGDTFDYTHRLLDRSLEHPKLTPKACHKTSPSCATGPLPRALDALTQEDILEPKNAHKQQKARDLTRESLQLPADTAAERGIRLQNLARADEGFLLSMAYSTQRGFGAVHPFTGELRRGPVEVDFVPAELGFAVTLGEVEFTECETVSCYTGKGGESALPPCFTRGYGLVFGNNERKALSMSLVDRALRAKELGEAPNSPAQNTEFVLLHSDNVEASGFVQHIKLPHYVDFQAELAMIRSLRKENK